MTFSNIPSKVSLFIDANILIYYFAPHATFGPECQLLLDRINKYQDLSPFTSTHVLSEVSHQLMILEAVQLFGWPLAGCTRRLQKHLDEVKKLTHFRQAIDISPPALADDHCGNDCDPTHYDHW